MHSAGIFCRTSRGSATEFNRRSDEFSGATPSSIASRPRLNSCFRQPQGRHRHRPAVTEDAKRQTSIMQQLAHSGCRSRNPPHRVLPPDASLRIPSRTAMDDGRWADRERTQTAHAQHESIQVQTPATIEMRDQRCDLPPARSSPRHRLEGLVHWHPCVGQTNIGGFSRGPDLFPQVGRHRPRAVPGSPAAVSPIATSTVATTSLTAGSSWSSSTWNSPTLQWSTISINTPISGIFNSLQPGPYLMTCGTIQMSSPPSAAKLPGRPGGVQLSQGGEPMLNPILQRRQKGDRIVFA